MGKKTSKTLQHNIEAIHRLTIIEGIPVVVFSRDELDAETMLPSGDFELFWYAFFNKKFYGGIELLKNLDTIEEEVEKMLGYAEVEIKKSKK